MPIHDGEPYLASAIDSIRCQTECEWELICVDDGSVDGTAEILSSYARADSRIRVLSQRKGGIVAALNRGIQQSRCEFIARMDADDLAMPDRLRIQKSYLLNNPDTAVVGGAFQSIDARGEGFKLNQPPQSAEEVRHALPHGNCIAHPSVMMRKSILNRYVGPYRNHFPLAEDYDLWLRISVEQAVTNVPDVVLLYRRDLSKLQSRKVIQQTISTAAIQHIHAQGISTQCWQDQDQIDEARLIGSGFCKNRLNSLVSRELLSNARVARMQGFRKVADELTESAWKYRPKGSAKRESAAFLWRVIKARCA
jgi:hypothetical protein